MFDFIENFYAFSVQINIYGRTKQEQLFLLYICVVAFEGCAYLWSQGVGFSYASFTDLWSHSEKLHKYHIFLQQIEDISVSLCCKNSDLVSKTVQIRQDSCSKVTPCEGHPPLPSTYIYTNTQKWYFKGWHNVAYTENNTWHSLFSGYNCGAGAGS